jgi:nucleoside-diphosphate-sugar epimerase
MRIVVVGASGNVGTSTLAALANDPDVESIVGVARRVPAWRPPKTEWVAADVVRSPLVPVFAGADVVIHLAWLIQPARDLSTVRAVNVDGSARVFDAVREAGVPALVYASSVGAYSPGPKDRRVDESWPTGGIATSYYSMHKAETERMLDRFERENPAVRVVRLRPGLIFKREAGSEIRRLFVGPLLPNRLLRPELIPVVPRIPRLRFQAVHSLDVGEAYRLAAVRDVHGPFNIAADPVLDPDELGRLLDARPVPVPAAVARGAAALTWRLRLQPTPESWVDMALAVPLLDTTRAREELGWQPKRTAGEALLDLIEGMREGAGTPTPPLDPGTSGPARVRELLTGVGGRDA